MNGNVEIGLAVAPVAPTPAQKPTGTVAERVVESTERSGPQTENQARLFGSSAAVLELVRSSAEAFHDILDAGGSVEAAAAMTGFTTAASGTTGQIVDEIA